VPCSAKVRRPFSAIPTARPSATALGVIRDGANRAQIDDGDGGVDTSLTNTLAKAYFGDPDQMAKIALAKAHIAAQGPCDQARRGYLHLSSLAHIDGRSVEARFDVGGAWSNPAQSL
jgi:hypothetical protein